jgi:hypothetical protein
MRHDSNTKLQGSPKLAAPNSFVLKILVSKPFAIKILQSAFLGTPVLSIF